MFLRRVHERVSQAIGNIPLFGEAVKYSKTCHSVFLNFYRQNNDEMDLVKNYS